MTINRLIDKNVILFALLSYSISINMVHATYLMWQDYIPFFNYSEISIEDVFIQFLFSGIAAFVAPAGIRRVSDIFFWVLLLFLYLPAVAIFLGEKTILSVDDLIVLFLLFVSFLIVSLPSIFYKRTFYVENQHFFYGNKLVVGFSITWFLFLFLLLNKFSSIMSLRGLDTVYEQRILGKADSLLYGYAQVYFGYVLSVGLVALGIFYKKCLIIMQGIIGCIILYAITAERTIFILPLFVFVIFKVVSSRKSQFWIVFFIFLSSAYFILLSVWGDHSETTKKLGFYYLTRVVAVPGLFFVDYLEYFRDVGYTYFTHAKGFSLFFDADLRLKQDPYFPELGRIVARDVHGINSNSNASFLSTDGIAGLGLIGMLIISVLLSFILHIANYLSRVWPPTLVIPIMAPMALVLTNGSLFTVLISFGMALWLLLLLISNIKSKQNLL